MHAQDLLVDDGSDWHRVKDVAEYFPGLEVVLAFALVVESVDAIDSGGLVVAPQQEEVLRVLDLVGQQQADALYGLLAAVHVVSQEEIVDIPGESALLKHLDQVGVLPVDIA
jgi:hypothetical protein